MAAGPAAHAASAGQLSRAPVITHGRFVATHVEKKASGDKLVAGTCGMLCASAAGNHKPRHSSRPDMKAEVAGPEDMEAAAERGLVVRHASLVASVGGGI